MGAKKFGSMEIDAIGEVLNISLGSSATAVSTMLDARVDITTPIVKVVTRDEFEFDELKPAIGVEINYIAGLEGKNIMLLKRNDVRIILNMLMGTETPLEEFEMDEMSISAICEVMNQMMGASATALSELLGRSVNISTPQSFEIGSSSEFKEKYFENNDVMVVVRFTLKIADKLESEFMNLMPVHLAKELVASLLGDYYVGDEEEEEEQQDSAPAQESPASENAAQEDTSSRPMSQADIDAALAAALGAAAPEEPAAPKAEPAAAPQPAPGMEMPPQQMYAQPAAPVNMGMGSPVMPGMQSGYMEAQMQQMQQMQQQIMMQMQQMQQLQQMQQTQMEEAAKAAPKEIKVHAVPQPNMSAPDSPAADGDANLDLVMGVPVEVSVEIGRTRKFVRDVLELNKGSLVVLDKLAGEQVDLYVNGQCIAKGDVVVVDDNFGIRITQILRDEINLI